MELLDHRTIVGLPRVDGPLHSLGDAFADRFHSWHGASGVRYVASVFPAGSDGELPPVETGVVVPVVREGRGRRALAVLVVERGLDSRRTLGPYAAQVDEWHVHLLAPDRRARADVASDLRARLDPARSTRLA